MPCAMIGRASTKCQDRSFRPFGQVNGCLVAGRTLHQIASPGSWTLVDGLLRGEPCLWINDTPPRSRFQIRQEKVDTSISSFAGFRPLAATLTLRERQGLSQLELRPGVMMTSKTPYGSPGFVEQSTVGCRAECGSGNGRISTVIQGGESARAARSRSSGCL